MTLSAFSSTQSRGGRQRLSSEPTHPVPFPFRRDDHSHILPPECQQNSHSRIYTHLLTTVWKTPQVDEAMDSIKAKIAAVRQSCTEVAFALEVASVTDHSLDKVTDASKLRLMGKCALILDEEVRRLTETGISHFQLILEQSHTTVEKIARVLEPNINRKKVVLFLKESPEKITEVRADGELLNVLLLHLRVMVAVIRLTAGG